MRKYISVLLVILTLYSFAAMAQKDGGSASVITPIVIKGTNGISVVKTGNVYTVDGAAVNDPNSITNITGDASIHVSTSGKTRALSFSNANNFVTASITNGLVTTAVTNGLASILYVDAQDGKRVSTNTTLSVTGPITGGGALDADRSFGYDGSVVHNDSGSTNLNASALNFGTVSVDRLPTGTATNVVGDSIFSITLSGNTYTLSPNYAIAVTNGGSYSFGTVNGKTPANFITNIANSSGISWSGQGGGTFTPAIDFSIIVTNNGSYSFGTVNGLTPANLHTNITGDAIFSFSGASGHSPSLSVDYTKSVTNGSVASFTTINGLTPANIQTNTSGDALHVFSGTAGHSYTMAVTYGSTGTAGGVTTNGSSPLFGAITATTLNGLSTSSLVTNNQGSVNFGTITGSTVVVTGAINGQAAGSFVTNNQSSVSFGSLNGQATGGFTTNNQGSANFGTVTNSTLIITGSLNGILPATFSTNITSSSTGVSITGQGTHVFNIAIDFSIFCTNGGSYSFGTINGLTPANIQTNTTGDLLHVFSGTAGHSYTMAITYGSTGTAGGVTTNGSSPLFGAVTVTTLNGTTPANIITNITSSNPNAVITGQGTQVLNILVNASSTNIQSQVPWESITNNGSTAYLITNSVAIPQINGGTGTNTSFTIGSIVFQNAAGTYGQDNVNLFWDNTNKRLGIGTNTPAVTLHLVTTNTGSAAGTIFSDSYSPNATGSAALVGRRARGTVALPTAVQTDDSLIAIAGRGYGATAFGSAARAVIAGRAGENWSDSAQGAYIVFQTTSNTTTTLAEVGRFSDVGNFGIGTNSPNAKLHVNGTSIIESTATFNGSIFNKFAKTPTNYTAGIGDYLITFRGTTATQVTNFLPTISTTITNGFTLVIKDGQNSAGTTNIVIMPVVGNTIDNTTNFYINANNGSVNLMVDGSGTNWIKW